MSRGDEMPKNVVMKLRDTLFDSSDSFEFEGTQFMRGMTGTIKQQIKRDTLPTTQKELIERIHNILMAYIGNTQLGIDPWIIYMLPDSCLDGLFSLVYEGICRVLVNHLKMSPLAVPKLPSNGVISIVMEFKKPIP
jgi:hypothetical protein